jgi:hypothetical protein
MICFVLTFFLIVVLIALGFALSSVGIWRRKPHSTIYTNHKNVTIEGKVKPLIEGKDIPVDSESEELVSQLTFGNSFNHTCSAVIRSHVPSDGMGFRNDSVGSMSLWTSDNGTLKRALHIDEKQMVGIGTRFPQYRLHVVGEVSSTVGFTVLSDANTKTVLEPISPESSLELNKLVTAKRFRRKYDGIGTEKDPDAIYYGFIAQDFTQQSVGDAIQSDIVKTIEKPRDIFTTLAATELLTLDYDAITAHLWNALQGAQSLIAQNTLMLETLIQEINLLESQCNMTCFKNNKIMER